MGPRIAAFERYGFHGMHDERSLRRHCQSQPRQWQAKQAAKCCCCPFGPLAEILTMHCRLHCTRPTTWLGSRKNQEGGEYAGTGPREAAWDHRGTLESDAEDDGKNASGNTEAHPPGPRKRASWVDVSMLVLFMYVLCSQISDDHANGCSRWWARVLGSLHAREGCMDGSRKYFCESERERE